MPQDGQGLDRNTWQRFKILLGILARSKILSFLAPWLLVLVVFSLSIAYVFGELAKIRGAIVTELTLGNQSGFYSAVFWFLGIAATLIFLDVFKRFFEDRLVQKLRKQVNITFLTHYLKPNVSYLIGLFRQVDNPDQRIEEDTRNFCAQTISFSLILVGALTTLVVQGKILFEQNRVLPFVAFGYAFLGSLLTYFVGRKLITLNWLQLMKEANYRFKLISLRENAEAINFYKKNAKEITKTRQYLREAVRNLLNIIAVNRNLGLVTGTYNHLIWLLPHLILAKSVLSGQKTYGEVITAAIAFEHFLGALSLIVANFQNLSSYAAVINRLGDLYEKMLNLADRPLKISHADFVKFQNVTIRVPSSGQILVRNLSFELTEGGLLIRGDSGVGKSSIFRVLATLWDSFDGQVTAPPFEKSFYVPQRPYVFQGSFLDQILYSCSQVPSLQEVDKVIDFVGLRYAVDKHGGLGSTQDWPKVLSIGDMQKLAWARLFLAKPYFAFLDEATTALDLELEAKFYKELQKFAKLWISIGLRDSLLQFHTKQLILQGNGEWQIK